MTSTQDTAGGEELEREVKATALRPLADKFQELTRQIDSGDYKLPKTIEDAEKITERYIDQAWQRIQPLIAKETSRVNEKYQELILAVGNKYPDETRHQTALRYIRSVENQSSPPAVQSEAYKEGE